MMRIAMVLASGPGQPEGDLDHRLELVAALTPQGQLDEAAYGETAWPSRRNVSDMVERSGELVREADGWVLRGRSGDDSPQWRVEGQVFRPGEYVGLTPPGGEVLVFRIVDVQPE